MAFAGVGGGLAALGGAQIGERAINEISEVMEILARPSWTRTVTWSEGSGKNKKEITDSYVFSKLDIILVGVTIYGIYWLWQEYQAEEDPASAEAFVKRLGRPFGYGLTNIVDPFNLFGLHEKEEEAVETIIDWIIP